MFNSLNILLVNNLSLYIQGVPMYLEKYLILTIFSIVSVAWISKSLRVSTIENNKINWKIDEAKLFRIENRACQMDGHLKLQLQSLLRGCSDGLIYIVNGYTTFLNQIRLKYMCRQKKIYKSKRLLRWDFKILNPSEPQSWTQREPKSGLALIRPIYRDCLESCLSVAHRLLAVTRRCKFWNSNLT